MAIPPEPGLTTDIFEPDSRQQGALPSNDDPTDNVTGRQYLMSRFERLQRHVRVHFNRAFLGGVSTSALVAGFLDATGVSWSLLAYVLLAAAAMVLILSIHALSNPRYRYLFLVSSWRKISPSGDGTGHLTPVAAGTSAPVRQIEAARCPDPVYSRGLRAICGPSEPLIIVASNRRDVSKQDELLFPMFANGRHHRQVKIDAAAARVPIPSYTFEREWPDGGQDAEHTLAIKDLVYLPELGAALREVGASNRPPLVWPEHCVDPQLLAERDVIIVGGADTNFWHAALFEPVVQEFERPESSVPLALNLRDATGPRPVYGSRVLTAKLAGLGSLFQHTRDDEIELDERLFPTYGMLLACRNPYAAAIDQSRWCVFIAGTRSLGTSGGVLALTLMLEAMRRDPARNFYSRIPTAAPDVQACVSAVLYRTTEVEQAMLRRGGQVLPRERRQLAPEGLDPDYSDAAVPTAVEYLSYDESDQPHWRLLGTVKANAEEQAARAPDGNSLTEKASVSLDSTK